ncbi:hypothetical protein [Microbacterium sp. KRD174]
MTDERLFGFIGAIRGNESNLVAMDAVSAVGEDHIRYPAGENVPPRKLSTRELEYVHRLDYAGAVRWRSGQAIWFAGRNLVARSSANSEVRAFAVDWHATQQGHRLVGGTPAGLRRMRDNYAEKLSTLFRKYVLDSEEVQVGEARATWELLQAFDNIASRRRSLNAALFAKDVDRNMDRFDAVCLRAVRSGAFDTLEAFDAELARLRAWMADPPLSRNVRVPAMSASASEFQSDVLARLVLEASESWKRSISSVRLTDILALASESSAANNSKVLLDRLRKTETSAP